MEKEEKNDSIEKLTSGLDDEEVIDGGKITDLDTSEYEADPIRRHKLTTARWLAYLLVIILASSFVIHYVTMALLASQEKTEALEIVENTFSAWLPVISGLTGAAVTYFFTRESDGKR